MADPDVDHGFVYTEDGYVDILASPFFDVHPGVDTTVNGYIERIRHTLVCSLEVHLGVFPRSGPADDDYPLHPSYVALQTLYRQAPAPAAAPSTSGSSTTTPVSATADFIPVSSAGSSWLRRYWWLFLLTVASAILVRLVLLLA